MRHLIKYIAIAIFISLPLLVQEESFAQAQELVLVSATESPVKPLTMLEIRQLYLGLSITRHNTRLMPLRNYSDKSLKQMFLQKIVFLSSKTYERQILRRTFGTGSRRPKAYDNSNDLIIALKRHQGSLTFMWRSKAMATPGITIVQELWISKDE